MIALQCAVFKAFDALGLTDLPLESCGHEFTSDQLCQAQTCER